MTHQRQTIDLTTAKELAFAALSWDSDALDAGEYFAFPDELIREYPWGWGFERVIEPYWSRKEVPVSVNAYGGDARYTVDRFSGKIQLLSSAEATRTIEPCFDLLLCAIGPQKYDVFKLLRQIKGWTASQTQAELTALPIVIARGPLLTIRAMHDLLQARGAKSEIKKTD